MDEISFTKVNYIGETFYRDVKPRGVLGFLASLVHFLTRVVETDPSFFRTVTLIARVCLI